MILTMMTPTIKMAAPPKKVDFFSFCKENAPIKTAAAAYLPNSLGTA